MHNNKDKIMPRLKRSSSLLSTRSNQIKNKLDNHHPNKDSKSPVRKLRRKSDNDENKLNLSLTDCTCPICLEILIEPVQMPCKHELCLPCFNSMTNMTSFLCPMCRMRISSWSRYAANSNALVNEQRWKQIQDAFPTEIKNRLTGKSAQIIAEAIEREKEEQKHPVSKPGEIYQEYQQYLKKEQERLRKEKESEESQSLALIERLIREEDNVNNINEYVNRATHSSSSTASNIQPRTPLAEQATNLSTHRENRGRPLKRPIHNTPTVSTTEVIVLESSQEVRPESESKTRSSLRRRPTRYTKASSTNECESHSRTLNNDTIDLSSAASTSMSLSSVADSSEYQLNSSQSSTASVESRYHFRSRGPKASRLI